MTGGSFENATVTAFRNPVAAKAETPFPDNLANVLSSADVAAARDTITTWPGYERTPLRDLKGLAAALGVDRIYYKDEGGRFGLGSFKALGGAYAVGRLIADLMENETGIRPNESEIAAGKHADFTRNVTVVTATDGNHGRSVAWGAQRYGCPCAIYMHAEVSAGRQSAVEAFGARVVRVDGNYDQSVRDAARDAAENGWHVVSDTSYDGYMEIPRQVMAGYTVMSGEIVEALKGAAPLTHVFVQGGVGGLAAALCAHFWQAWGAGRPRFVIAEPDRAACLLASARAGRPAMVEVEEETVMAGLSCGEVSLLAWDILSPGANDFMTLADDLVQPTMRLLADGTGGGRAFRGGRIGRRRPGGGHRRPAPGDPVAGPGPRRGKPRPVDRLGGRDGRRGLPGNGRTTPGGDCHHVNRMKQGLTGREGGSGDSTLSHAPANATIRNANVLPSRLGPMTSSIFETLHVLVIDDEEFALNFSARVLTKLGVSAVSTAANGAEALIRLAEAAPPVSLVICDIMMPDMDGYEFVRRVRYGMVPTSKSVPIVMLTGEDTEKNLQKARIHRINGFVVKPPTKESLGEAIVQAIKT